jgi:hypothetical protein
MVEVNLIGRNLQPLQPAAGVKKVIAVFVYLESNQIGAQKPIQQFFTWTQTAEDFGGRERSMQEKSNFGLW